MFVSVSKKNNGKISLIVIILLRFCKTKVVEEHFYGAKKPIKIWDVDVDKIVTWKLIDTKNNI